MKNVDYLLESMGETAAYAQEYVEHRIELAKMEAVERGSVIISESATAMVFVAMGTFVFLLANITIGLFLGQMIESFAMAFLFLTLFYLLITTILFFFRYKFITNPILSILVSKLFISDVDENVEDAAPPEIQ